MAAGLAVLAVTACGRAAPRPPHRRRRPPAGPLAGVCPDTVVVQTDWFPEAEYGAYFQMLGENPQFDIEREEGDGPARRRRPRPPACSSRSATAARRSAIQQVSAQLYADKAITLGLVSTDEAIQNSAELADASPSPHRWRPARR